MPDDPSEPTDQTEMTESMAEVMSLDGDVERLATYYDDWAAEYDDDVASHDYGLPSMMVEMIERVAALGGAAARFADRSCRVLDAGCGTGLVGVALHEAGYTDLHGIDLSEEMVEVARRRGIFGELEGGIDLTVPVPERWRHAADIVTVGGVFTVGHVPPEALRVVAELVRPGGLLVVSTRRAYQESTDFADTAARFAAEGVLELLVHQADAPYTMDSTGDYWAWCVPGTG